MYGLRSSFNIDQVVHEPGPSDPTPTLADTFAFILIVVIGAASAGAWLTDRLIAGYEPWQLALAIVACSVLVALLLARLLRVTAGWLLVLLVAVWALFGYIVVSPVDAVASVLMGSSASWIAAFILLGVVLLALKLVRLVAMVAAIGVALGVGTIAWSVISANLNQELPSSFVASVATEPVATEAPPPEQSTSVAPTSVWVGNTDGEGVYLRNSPDLADRVRAYPDGTELTVVGDDVEGDGRQWHHVRAPDGLEGYVPAEYTLDAAPAD
jgi:hypothetical protein